MQPINIRFWVVHPHLGKHFSGLGIQSFNVIQLPFSNAEAVYYYVVVIIIIIYSSKDQSVWSLIFLHVYINRI